MSQRLRREIDRLREWLTEAQDPNEYPDSGDLYAAVESLLDTLPLSDSQLRLLLDTLALDDEAEIVQDSVRERTEAAIQVARAGIDHPDARARWQAAVLAGEMAPEEVAHRYLADPDEYVRRRALTSARDRFPSLAESTATAWLDSTDEYSRMVALDTLYVLESDRYAMAAQQLAGDPSPVVQGWLKRANTERA